MIASSGKQPSRRFSEECDSSSNQKLFEARRVVTGDGVWNDISHFHRKPNPAKPNTHVAPHANVSTGVANDKMMELTSV